MSQSELTFQYEKAGYEESTLVFSYDKAPTPFSQSKLSFGYEKALGTLTSWEPTVTPLSYMTQIIGNTFPLWHGGRIKYGGRTQRVINSLAGFELSRFMHTLSRFRANLFLPTIDTSPVYQIWAAPRPVSTNDQQAVNLLINPSFQAIKVSRLGPYAWSSDIPASTGSFEVIEGNGLYGYYGIRLTAEADEYISLQQIVDASFSKGVSFTATLWYAGMRPVGEGSISAEDGPSLIIVTTYQDGTTEVDSVPLVVNTGGAYKKTSITVSPVKMVSSIEFNISVKPIGDIASVIEIGGAQLEQGETSTPWTPFIFDLNNLYLVDEKESITESTSWGDITYNRQERIEVKDTYTFDVLSDISLPNRASVSAATTETATTYTTYDMYIDEIGTQFNVGWRIANNYIERYDASNTMSDVFHTLKIADLFGDGSDSLLYFKPSELGVTQTYEALTVAIDKIYVVVKETWQGKTQRVLKICNPGVRWDDTGHLESVGEVKINDGSGTCTSIGLVDKRVDKLLITIDATDYIVDLIWDSAARTQQGLVLLRSNPGTKVLVG